MLRLLLITTGYNQVLSALKANTDIELFVVDCASETDAMRYMEKQAQVAFAKHLMPDIILTYRCPYILLKETFSIPRYGAYNLHPSLLPKYAGLNPWDNIFHNKETIGGVTLHRITEKVDAGEFLFQQEYPICCEEGIETARQKADQIAATLISNLLQSILQQ